LSKTAMFATPLSQERTKKKESWGVAVLILAAAACDYGV
jgi:hypothetical protein